MALSPSGQPCIAYRDGLASARVSVMKFEGTSWEYVGDPGFSAGPTWITDITLSQSGQPYVAYQDYGNDGKATVMKYDSVYVGINELQESRLSLYPNPASQELFITCKDGTIVEEVVICDQIGQKILHRQPVPQPIDVSMLRQGMYIVEVISGDFRYKEKLVIK